jgi:CsoR family transcriptional regulator, copper-sensing transcriptional repressor
VKSYYKDKKIEAQKRLNIIKGQVDGLSRMIENDDYCVDLLNQSLAIKNALKGLDAVLFERHLNTHVKDQFKNKEDLAIKELTTLFKSLNK